MRTRYRYVRYGTRFESRPGPRPEGHDHHPEQLFENEIAADVGQRFWSRGRESRPGAEAHRVIDHHFASEAQFPSASAAVLHSASRVHSWWAECIAKNFSEVCLVTHQSPDLDALASLYLIRSLESWNQLNVGDLGLAPDSWRDLTPEEHPHGKRRFDWFKMPSSELDSESRWRLGLAVAASLTDQCRRFECPRTQSTPAVFYAALERGRRILEDGAVAFFEEFRRAVADDHKNPVTDALFSPETSEFAQEMRLLEQDMEKYDRDVARARRVVVAIPEYRGDFEPWYQIRQGTELLQPDGSLYPLHTETGSARAVDGIFLRDPESVLFKSIARTDYENPTLRQGFFFTAVAYSDRKPDSEPNRTDYYFALDPERAGPLTLYPVWAALQAAEIRAMPDGFREEHRAQAPREGYEERAAQLGGIMRDPWFDGANFATTLVVTPDRGTFIGPPGVQADLDDDPVAQIVTRVLDGVAGASRVIDFEAGKVRPPLSTPPEYRFCSVAMIPGLDASARGLGRQIGERLWELLHPGVSGIPTDFEESHLIRNRDRVEVWSRLGIGIAFHDDPPGRQRASHISERFGQVIELLDRAGRHDVSAGATKLVEAEGLWRDIDRMRRDLAKAHGSIALRRFVDASGFHDSLTTVREILASQRSHQLALSTQEVLQALEKDQNSVAKTQDAIRTGQEEIHAAQEKVEVLETLIVTLYAIELVHILVGALTQRAFFEVYAVCGVGLAVLLLVWRGLPKKKAARGWREFNPLSLVTILTMLVLLAGLIFTLPWFRGHLQGWVGEAPASSQVPSGTQSVTGPK